MRIIRKQKKQKGQCYLGELHASIASFFENNLRHGGGGGIDGLIQNEILGKNVERAIFGHDLMNTSRRVDLSEVDHCQKERSNSFVNDSCIS